MIDLPSPGSISKLGSFEMHARWMTAVQPASARSRVARSRMSALISVRFGWPFTAASTRTLTPQKLDHTLAFMFESRWRFKPSAWAMRPVADGGPLDLNYAACWSGLKDNFPSELSASSET